MNGTIVTRHASASTARSIAAALKADNRTAPTPLSVTARVNGNRVTSAIAGAQDVGSLLTTIDDLLLCLIAADKMVRVIETVSRERHGEYSLADSRATKV